MRRLALFLLPLVSLSTLACGKDKDGDSQPPTPPPESSVVAKVPTAPEPVAPQVPRLAKLFVEGAECAWSEQGMTKCPSAKAIKDLAFNNQGSSELAASCAKALSDESTAVRGLAATCLQGFNDRTLSPNLGAGLDAYEAEKDAGLKHLFAWSFGAGNAAKGGVEARYIELIERLAKNSDTEQHAAFLFRALFPQYVMSSSPPSKEAGDFALKMANSQSAAVMSKAVVALGLLTDRADEVCPELAGLTNDNTWTETIPAMMKVGGPCIANVDVPVERLASALGSGKFYASHATVLRSVLRTASLSEAQLGLLRDASKKNVAASKDRMLEKAKKIDADIASYTDPAASAK